MKSATLYPIKLVARITGLGIDTLRAWERRHGAITPQRDGRGRMYSDADVQRLRLLRDAVAGGHSIGRIAALDEAALRDLADDTTALTNGRESNIPRPAMMNTDDIIAALARFDAAAVESQLSRAAALLNAPELLRRVIVPVLTAIGDAWHSGRATVAHEHLLSSVVRNVLGSLMRVHTRADAPDRLLFATPCGERHEFGTLGAALMAASGGLGAVYLGADLPAQDLIDITATVDVDVIVLGVTAADDAPDAIAREVERVAGAVSRDVELWIGGPASEQIAASIQPRALAIPDYDALESQLARLGARF